MWQNIYAIRDEVLITRCANTISEINNIVDKDMQGFEQT